MVFLLCDTFGFSLEVAEIIAENTPIMLKESITKSEAENLKMKFENLGATVEFCESASKLEAEKILCRLNS